MVPTVETVYTRAIFLSTSSVEQLNKHYFSKNMNDDKSFPMIHELLLNHRKCSYWKTLKFHCPSCLEKVKTRKERKVLQKNLPSDFTNINKVFLFVRSILLKLIPAKFLGTQHNLHIFLDSVRNLLSLQLHDSMSVDHMTHGIQTSKLIWLKYLDKKQQKKKLEQAIHFIVKRVIGPLIGSFFHVTESDMYKNRLFFFRKKTWCHLIHAATSRYIHSGHLKKVSAQWVTEKRKSGHCLGVSQVRFLLKKTGVRTIVNMAKARSGISINKHLQTLLRVLTFEKENCPNAFGATIMSVDELYVKWKMYTAKQQSYQKFFCVKVDIEKCFDTINLCLLYSIVKKLFTKTHYTVHKMKRLIKTNQGVTKTVCFETLEPPRKHTKEGSRVKLCGSYSVTREIMIEKLRSLLFCNVVKLGRNHYVQTLGIAQGSSLSSILCGAYFGHLDRTMLIDVIDESDLLIRAVDDILLVTRHKANAMSFLKIFLEGFPEFNCRCNLMKSCTNFEYSHPVFGNVPFLAEDALLSFYGLAFNTNNLEVFLDFTNYKNIQTRDTISWNMTRHVGERLKSKMLLYVRPKCLCICFDGGINSINTILYNLASIFAICAVKFHCLVKLLPKRGSIVSNPVFFTGIINSLPRELVSFISRKMSKINGGRKRYIFPLSLKIVRKVCALTFLYKLKKHSSIYTPIIEELSQSISMRKSTCDITITKMFPKVFEDIYLK